MRFGPVVKGLNAFARGSARAPFLCRLGLHRWTTLVAKARPSKAVSRCARCAKVRVKATKRRR